MSVGYRSAIRRSSSNGRTVSRSSYGRMSWLRERPGSRHPLGTNASLRELREPHHQQRAQRLDGRNVEHAVDLFRAEVALEGRDGVARIAVQIAGRRHRVAIAAEHVLKFLDGGIGLAEHIEWS